MSTCPAASVRTVSARVPSRMFPLEPPAGAWCFSWPRCSVIPSSSAVSSTVAVIALSSPSGPVRSSPRARAALTSSRTAARSTPDRIKEAPHRYPCPNSCPNSGHEAVNPGVSRPFAVIGERTPRRTKPQFTRAMTCGSESGQGRGRTADLPIFRRRIEWAGSVRTRGPDSPAACQPSRGPPVVSFLVSFVCVQGGSCTALWIVVERV